MRLLGLGMAMVEIARERKLVIVVDAESAVRRTPINGKR